MADTRIEVHGLRELRRALKEAEGRSQSELRHANKRAADLIAREAARRAPKGPHQGKGKPNPITPISQSIKSRSTTNAAYVVFGGSRSPHAPVYEFGGSIPRRGARATHGAAIAKAQAGHRSFEKAGIPVTRIAKRPFVYPAIEAEIPHVLEQYERALIALTSDL